jgi:glycosyltransferase involved in cell wall biosynthesis
VEAITALRDDPQLRERMGANARRVFEERYDKPIAIKQWRQLLHDLGDIRSW